MAVLVEAFNVIAKLSAIESKYSGGVAGYKRDCPTEAYCQDDHICRLGFEDAEGAQQWANLLLAAGLDGEVNGTLQDLAFADSFKGLIAPCEWLEFLRDEDGTLWTWRRGTAMGEKIAHEGWKPGQFFWVDKEDIPSQRVHDSDKKWWQVWR